jgi:hypothetical protein
MGGYLLCPYKFLRLEIKWILKGVPKKFAGK